MRRAATWKAIRKAREFMFKSGINSLPVDPFALYKQHGWKLRSNSDVEKKYRQRDPFELKKDNVDALTYWNGENYLTVYDDSKSPERIRWTLAHEIGHIFMGHLIEIRTLKTLRGLDEGLYKVLEREANYFAKELLTPLWLLNRLNVRSVEDISWICKVSVPAAEIIESELRDHLHKTIHQESRSFYSNRFKDFLDPVSVCSSDIEISFGKIRTAVKPAELGYLRVDTDYTKRYMCCPKCYNESFSIDASYCKCCGTSLYKLQRVRRRTECNRINELDATYCESCGSLTYSISRGLLVYWKQLLEWNGSRNVRINI